MSGENNMIQSVEQQGHAVSRRPSKPGGANQWRDTILIWSAVALGGMPIFGGPELLPAGLTLFAFFVAFGAAATLLIWLWPAVWKRWFHSIPSKGSWRPSAW
jgi:hypothetical protein